jgi:hypothetical protein
MEEKGMPFGDYKTLADAIRALQVTETWEEFIQPVSLAVSDHFRSKLKVRLADRPVDCSEWAVCENLLYPVLDEVAQNYAEFITIWSHVSLYQRDRILGTPDYIIAKRSPLSIRVMDMPLAMIMEAKRNDFDMGWGQCLAAMHAAQSLTGDPERVVYGGVSDGFSWRFGKLRGQALVVHPQLYDVFRLDELFGALNHVLQLCKEQVLSPAAAA